MTIAAAILSIIIFEIPSENGEKASAGPFPGNFKNGANGFKMASAGYEGVYRYDNGFCFKDTRLRIGGERPFPALLPLISGSVLVLLTLVN